ncbi:helix-turn-helix domain-containing protein [Leptolyngbya sp. AN03gr2]|uniref:helix-turn-helix domain-containing protein n=1 Tax=unclassified Leptolyngbya TaxID=2650499 RepID=UPI003D31F58B
MSALSLPALKRQGFSRGSDEVSEVAQAIGFANRSHFAEAFRKKFGVNPKDYQMQRRKLGISS